MHKHDWLLAVLEDVHLYACDNKISNFVHLIEAAKASLESAIKANDPKTENSSSNFPLSSESQSLVSIKNDIQSEIDKWVVDLNGKSVIYH